MVRDREAERVQAALQQERRLLGIDEQPDPISTPGERRGNGKRWWNEVWGKVAAGLLLLVLTGLITGAWAKAKDATAATVELYTLPGKFAGHDRLLLQHDADIKALKEAQMPAGMADRLDRWLKKQEHAK